MGLVQAPTRSTIDVWTKYGPRWAYNQRKAHTFRPPVLHPLDLLGPGVQASGAATGGLATLGPATSAAGSPHAPHDWIYEDGLVKERAGVFGQRFFVFDGFLMDQISVGMDFCWE